MAESLTRITLPGDNSWQLLNDSTQTLVSIDPEGATGVQVGLSSSNTTDPASGQYQKVPRNGWIRSLNGSFAYARSSTGQTIAVNAGV